MPQESAKPDYLAFLGRIAPEKGPDSAIRIARACGIPLKIAAKMDRADQSYFDAVIRPMLDDGGVEMVGEISDTEKPAFLSGAIALLMPIVWPEPFGLVMIEAMACGTPVIAFNRGSVPEIIDDGVTGFIVEDEAARSPLFRLGSFVAQTGASGDSWRDSPLGAWPRTTSRSTANWLGRMARRTRPWRRRQIKPRQVAPISTRSSGRGLRNYWGYNTIGFFAPHPEYLGAEGLGGFKAFGTANTRRRHRGHP